MLGCGNGVRGWKMGGGEREVGVQSEGKKWMIWNGNGRIGVRACGVAETLMVAFLGFWSKKKKTTTTKEEKPTRVTSLTATKA